VDDSYVARGPKDWVWPPGRVDQWGIAPPKPDHVKAAQIAVPFAAGVELAAAR
jgi:catechol 2,3-dioxygenase